MAVMREEAGRRDFVFVIKLSIITKTVEIDTFIEDNVKGREVDREHTFSNNVDLYVAREVRVRFETMLVMPREVSFVR